MNARQILYRLTHWETWHYLVKYVFIAPAWFWYCARAGSFWFFTPSNPGLTFGGFEGESKKEMYDQLPPGSYPNSIYIDHRLPFIEVEKRFAISSLKYPCAVKPDVGMMGLLFRKIHNTCELRRYHEMMPVDYILQSFVSYPLEVSIFYYRFPGEAQGIITGFLRKEYLQVTGDGRSTLLELMTDYQRAFLRLEEMKAKHRDNLQDIIPNGEVYCLSYALNLSRGGRLINLEHEKDDRLLKVFDDLSHYTKSFYYGRYDIKCVSIEDLKNGKNYSILEYNGSGAEPHHVYHNGNTLFQAHKVLLHHWNILFKISRYNNRNGIPYWKFSRGIKFIRKARKHFALLKELDSASGI